MAVACTAGSNPPPNAAQMASKHTHATEDLRFRVLRLLQDNPDLSQRDLAARLGVSNGKLNYCLRALIDKGLVKLGNFAQSTHHLGYAYLLTPAGIAEKAAPTHNFLKRKLAEYEALKAEIESLTAPIAPTGTATQTNAAQPTNVGAAEAANSTAPFAPPGART